MGSIGWGTQGRILCDARLFPEFYSLCANGISESDLLEHFCDEQRDRLRRFIRKLCKVHALTDCIQSIDEIFFFQKNLFQTEKKYDHNYFMKKDNVQKFAERSRNRQVIHGDERIAVPVGEQQAVFENRKSIRNFDTSRKTKLRDFMGMMQLFMKKPDESGYYYASAGGLYPLDAYVFVKEDCVEGLGSGLYYINPAGRCIEKIDNGKDFDEDMHYAMNRSIYARSAFSVFLVYNAEFSIPKYGGRAYYYALLDSGILVGNLNLAAECYSLGSCSIGDMNFRKIEKAFHLNNFQQYLHCVIFGNI